MPRVGEGEERLAIPPQLQYLGHAIHLTCALPRDLFNKRVSHATTTLRKIGQLPKSLSYRARSTAAEMAAFSQLAYGMLVHMPSRMALRPLDRFAKSLIWKGGKKMHSWPLACAFVFRPHRMSAYHICVYQHLHFLIRSLSQGALMWSTWFPPERKKARGPLQVASEMPDLWDAPGPHPSVLSSPLESLRSETVQKGSFEHELRAAIRHDLIKTAAKNRPALAGHQGIDLEVTSVPFQRKGCRDFAEHITMVTDGIWTGKRLCHAGHQDHPGCVHCPCDQEAAQRILWECPRWAALRTLELSDKEHRALQRIPASAVCGLYHRDLGERLKGIWSRLQGQLAAIIRAHNFTH